MTRLADPAEWQEQVALITWCRLHETHEPRLALLYHWRPDDPTHSVAHCERIESTRALG